MASEDRQQEPSVGQLLTEDPCHFNFFQAVRLIHLELLRHPRGSSREEGPVRFKSNPTLRFCASDIQEIDREQADAKQARPAYRMLINFMGLAGHDGPLPDHYTEMIIERARARDGTLRAFLDIFNHRLVQLFYEAWARPRFFIAFERGEDDLLQQATRALIGQGISTRTGESPEMARLSTYYAGCLLRRPLSAEAASTVISSYFEGIPVEIEQFEGRWLELDDESCFVLGDAATSSELGQFCPLGRRIWDVQGQIKVKVGPVCYQDFIDFRPGEWRAKALVSLTRFLTGDELAFKTEIVLAPGDIPGWVLTSEPGNSHALGESAWLGLRHIREPISVFYDDHDTSADDR